MMSAVLSVRIRAASMYSSSRSASTAARTLRATISEKGIATATMIAGRELPNAASSIAPKTTTGSASRTSNTRERTSSTTPRRKPVTSPRVVPRTVARSAAAGARIRISRPPSITRANESRPRRSVPNQWSREGAASALRGSVASGSCGAMSPPNVVQSTQKATMAAPARTSAAKQVVQLLPAGAVHSSAGPPGRLRPRSRWRRRPRDAERCVAGDGLPASGRRRGRPPGRMVMRPPYLRGGRNVGCVDQRVRRPAGRAVGRFRIPPCCTRPRLPPTGPAASGSRRQDKSPPRAHRRAIYCRAPIRSRATAGGAFKPLEA